MAALSAIRPPDVDPSKLAFPKVQLPEAAKVELPSIDISQLDLAGTIQDAAAVAGFPRPASRLRLPVALGGLLLAGAAIWALMSRPQLRTRLRDLGNSMRGRISSMRSNAFDLAPADPIAFPEADTKPIQPAPWDGGENNEAPDYPEGLGSREEGQISSLHGSKSRR